MLIVLAAYYLAARTVEAFPIASIDQNTPPRGERTVWDILWSCLTTIFICTWVAMHPDIPDVDTNMGIFRRHLQLMVLVLIAPEQVVLMAMRQRYTARAIEKSKSKCAFVHSCEFGIA